MGDTFDLTGKQAIVTGGASGIGEAIAKTLAAHGAFVNIFDLSIENADKVVSDIIDKGNLAESFVCDVSDWQEIKSTFDSATNNKTLDILVNNAGIAHVGNISNTTGDDLDKLYQVNVKGVYHGMKAGIELMKQQGGSIINISSVAAHVAVADRFAYSMTKGAVHAMSLSVAKDYLEHNIRCNTISPARVHTPFVDGFIAKNYPGKEKEKFNELSKSQPIGRMGQPSEIGSLVLYLASDEASFVTGTDFPIDGGFLKLNS